MTAFPVIEKFVSIDGEGPTAGALSVFVRFAGCNLRCGWCDTSYAWREEPGTERLTAREIADYIRSAGVRHVTLTGGEPLLQEGLVTLLARLSDYEVHVETNGSLGVEPFRIADNIHFVIDYKLPGSGMEDRMDLSNLAAVRPNDTYKFVMADRADMDRAFAVIDKYRLDSRCQVFLSVAFGRLSPAEVVDEMKKRRADRLRLQLQLHKYIWDKNRRGV